MTTETIQRSAVLQNSKYIIDPYHQILRSFLRPFVHIMKYM